MIVHARPLCVVAFALLIGSVTSHSFADHREHDRRAQYLERVYEDFARGKADAVTARLPTQIVWHMIGWREDVVPFAGEYSGRKEVRELLRRYFAQIAVSSYAFEYALSDGAYTTWHFRLVGQVAATGKTFDAEVVHLWQFDESDRPISVRAYMDTQLLTDAFSPEGANTLSDRKNASDDYIVRDTTFDVQGLVEAVYDNFYAGDIPAVLEKLSPDVAIYFQGHDNPQSGEYHGKQGALQFAMNLAGTAMPGDIERFFVTQGDRTDVILFENWTVYSTGKQYHVHTVNSWRVDADGHLLGFINYPDVDAVAAAYVP